MTCSNPMNTKALQINALLTVRRIIIVGLFLRILVAIWNGFIRPSIGGDADAVSFHNAAVNYAKSLTMSGFKIHHTYPYILGLFYHLTGNFIFLGCLLSCLAWLGSAFLLMKTMQLLRFDESCQLGVMLIYAMLPSSVFFTSVTLREVYQLLFVNLAAYSALKIFLDMSAKHWLLLIFAAVGLCVLHGALFAFGIYILATTTVLACFRDRKDFRVARAVLVALLVATIIFCGFSLFTTLYTYKVKSGFAKAVESYQKGSLAYQKVARAFYKERIEIKKSLGFLPFLFVSFFQYLFEPIPWHISAVVDFEAVFENILRALLIWMAITGFRKLRSDMRISVAFIFISYIFIEVLWSLGTINWGTSIRHHIPGMGLLLVAAFASSPRLSTTRFKDASAKTIEGFGYEWTRFDQSSLSGKEQKEIFENYFSIFPWHLLSTNSEGFDLGCGSGRWAGLVAPRVGRLHCIDPSIAIDVARKNMAHMPNCEFHKTTVNDIPLKSGSMDFGYSLGVLHHIPDTQGALTSCVKKLKPGAPFLVYLYYAFDNKPKWFCYIWRFSNIMRIIISRFPFWLKYLFSQILAVFVYLPLAKTALVLEKTGVDVNNFPLSAYRNRSFYTMRTDALDRFGTGIERRFTRKEINTIMERSGLERIKFSDNVPFWCAVGYRKS